MTESESLLFLAAPVFSSLRQQAIHICIPHAHVRLDWGLVWAIKKIPHDGDLCLLLENAVESAFSAGDEYNRSPGNHPSPSHRQMPLPTLKLADAWAEEDGTNTLPNLQEWTWDDDSIITRGR